MQRFIHSAFTVLLATAASAPEALALKPVDADFNLQSQRLAELDARNKGAISPTFKLHSQRLAELAARNKGAISPTFKLHSQRLAELDARNKSADNSQPYYSQPSTQASPQTVSTEQESTPAPEPTVWETPETPVEDASPALSVTERRQQSLDRN
ncbi:MAG: hypothetical protein ACFB0D_21025 [Phormidesmis sp.]